MSQPIKRCWMSNIRQFYCFIVCCRCAELLIMYQADINHAAERGQTPLYLACKNGNNDCIKLLLESGADRTVKTSVS